MAESDTELTVRDLAHVVVRRKWIVVVAILFATVTAVVLSALQTPLYAADSQVLIEPRGDDALFAARESLGGRAIRTEIQVVQGETVRLRVQEDLELSEESPDAEVTAIGDTDVIMITVTDPNAENAAILANAYAVAYIEIRREQSIEELLTAAEQVQLAIDQLQIQIDGTTDRIVRESFVDQQTGFSVRLDQLRVDAALRTGGATIIKQASVPESPIEPTPARDAVFAAVIGLLIGLGAAYVIHYLDDKVRTIEDLSRVSQYPVLVQVPVDTPPDRQPIALSAANSPAGEAYRGLRTNLQFLALDRELRVVHVSSSISGEGRTTTAANLAIVLARAGHRVAVVDADLRRPGMHVAFGVSAVPGLTELLLGAAPRDVVRHVDIGGGDTISLYPAGAVPANPGEILSSKRTGVLLAEMGAHYDYVIVDSAPILPVSDAISIAQFADGVLIVTEAGRVTRDNVSRAVGRLDGVSASVLGFVLNEADLGDVEDPYHPAVPSSAAVESISIDDGVPADV